MDISNIILSDEALSVVDNGAWVEVGASAPGVEFLVTGMQSAQCRKLMSQKQAMARAKNRGEPLTEEQLAGITKEVLHESVLKGWRGLSNAGKPVEYDAALAKSWIMSRNGEAFTRMVLICAQKIDNMAAEFVEDVSKNSSPASAGHSSTQTRAK